MQLNKNLCNILKFTLCTQNDRVETNRDFNGSQPEDPETVTVEC